MQVGVFYGLIELATGTGIWYSSPLVNHKSHPMLMLKLVMCTYVCTLHTHIVDHELLFIIQF